jgi:hypothetical protein
MNYLSTDGKKKFKHFCIDVVYNLNTVLKILEVNTHKK